MHEQIIIAQRDQNHVAAELAHLLSQEDDVYRVGRFDQHVPEVLVTDVRQLLSEPQVVVVGSEGRERRGDVRFLLFVWIEFETERAANRGKKVRLLCQKDLALR